MFAPWKASDESVSSDLFLHVIPSALTIFDKLREYDGQGMKVRSHIENISGEFQGRKKKHVLGR